MVKQFICNLFNQFNQAVTPRSNNAVHAEL